MALAVAHTVADLRARIAAWRAAGESVGLVPTMGALHDGHAALVRAARAASRRTVATIFVNPKQFNDARDLAGYPRDRAGDAALLAGAGADLLYAPAVEQVYPAGFATEVSVSGITDCLCGAARPGHFAGVSTVVAKLLLQALPDAAWFGEKDYQQLLVVRRMARDLDIPVRIEAVPTVREPDGLALSSRNRNLTAAQRARAPALYRVLGEMAGHLARGAPAAPVLADGRAALVRAGFDPIDYLELRDGETLAALDRAGRDARLFGAAWLGATRLIDNLAVR